MEIFSSWALFIMIMLLIIALFTSYMLQQKKVEAVHETVISIFAGRDNKIDTSEVTNNIL
jgi:sodium/hydrogen exchanger-like protein 6/7